MLCHSEIPVWMLPSSLSVSKQRRSSLPHLREIKGGKLSSASDLYKYGVFDVENSPDDIVQELLLTVARLEGAAREGSATVKGARHGVTAWKGGDGAAWYAAQLVIRSHGLA
jgi:hypothetical protein